MRHVRMLVHAGVAALAAGSALIVLLHLVGPTAEISPIRQTISEYGLTSVAWVFDLAVLAVAAGSAAVLVAVATVRRRSCWGDRSRWGDWAGLTLGGLWVAGLATVVSFPKTNWAVGPSVSGQIHRAASLVAFIALPFAVIVLLRRRRSRERSEPRSGLQRAGTLLALTSLAWFVPIVVAIATARGAWWLAIPLGLLERGMAVTEIAALVVTGIWAGAKVPAATVPASTTAGPAAFASPLNDVTTGRSITDQAVP